MSMQQPRESYDPGVSQYTDDEEIVSYDEGGSSSQSSSYDTASEVQSEVAVSATAAAASRNNTNTTPPQRQKKQYAVSTRWEREVAANGLPRDFSSYFCCCAHRIGSMFILWEKADGSPIVIAGPCWPFCVGVTLPLILGISGVASYFAFFSPSTSVVSIVGIDTIMRQFSFRHSQLISCLLEIANLGSLYLLSSACNGISLSVLRKLS